MNKSIEDEIKDAIRLEVTPNGQIVLSDMEDVRADWTSTIDELADWHRSKIRKLGEEIKARSEVMDDPGGRTPYAGPWDIDGAVANACGETKPDVD